ncbi:MAG: AAA family ATPase [Rhodobacteraceae bacterium]|nr:AAA family ATPase [Paracoccaceae bacterium]
MPDHADIYLICGATGAGKTTHAEALALEVSGLRFSIDEWMQRLHNPDKPETDLFEWFYPRVERNWAQMRSVAERLVELNIPAIFDCGLTRKSEREMFDFMEALWEQPDAREMASLNGVRIPA